MNKNQRKRWLNDLTIKQLRALASQNRVDDWKTLSRMKLLKALSAIKGVEQPQPTWKL